MSFLRRLLGGTDEAEAGATERAAERAAERTPGRGAASPSTSADFDDDERQYELDIAREEARRMSELQQRQLRYAHKSWTPPRQGGERRADDEDADKRDES